MKCLVFLPGIMGSELRDSVRNKRVWPPRLSQIIRKSVDVDDLLSPDLFATKPIETIARFYPVYRSLLRDIKACGYTTDGVDKKLISFAYDWRKSNEDTARALADLLDQQPQFDDIVLLGHSMGGLVLRYILESGEFDERFWFPQITQIITLGTPHHGAAKALQQVAGLAANTGLTAENVKKLASDTRYPSAYELIAPAGTGITLRTARRGELPIAIDPFDDDIVSRYGLSSDNIAASRRFWSQLDVSKRPPTVRYFSFVGSAQKTLYRLDWDGRQLIEVEGKDSGDGTVPISSALELETPHTFSEKSHANIFADRRLRFELYKMLGASSQVEPQSADATVAVGAPDAIGITTDKDEYRPQDSMEIGISYTQPHHNPTCRLQMVAIDERSDTGDMLEFIGDPMSVNFDGADVESARFNIQIDMPPGVYELRVAGKVDDPERTLFVVTEQA